MSQVDKNQSKECEHSRSFKRTDGICMACIPLEMGGVDFGEAGLISNTMKWNEKESALIAIFAIHQTKDTDDVIRNAMKSILDTYTERVKQDTIQSLKERIEILTKEQLDKNDPDNYGACYAIGGWNHALQTVINLLDKENI
jgi:folylpolyglutamate synthase/dihydropteroate synthase